jgi:antitoxin HicB
VSRTTYAVVLEAEEEGGYSVWVPELPGCASQGETRDEALANIREAIACYLEALEKLGQAPPRPRAAEVEVVSIEAA